MPRKRWLSGVLENPPDARNDVVFFVFLLAACLAYNCYTSVIYLTSFVHGIFDFAWRPIGRDFVNYWTGAVAVFDGLVLQIFDAGRFHLYQEQLFGHGFAEHNWSYPPHMLLLVLPLGQLPYLWALAAWSFLGLGLYLWVSTTGRAYARLLLLVLLLAPATFANFSGGQNGFLTGALLIGGLRLLSPRPILAGILFGILTVKPQLGILLPFALLAARQWTAIASATVTTVVVVGTSVLLFGWESWEAYIEVVVPYQAAIMNEGHGFFLGMMPTAYIGLRLLEVDEAVRNGIQIAVSLVAVAGVAWAFARSKDEDLKLGAIAVGTLLASPYGFNYDMTAVSLAVALLGLRGLRQGFLPGERVTLSTVWLLPTAVQWLNANYLPIGAPVLLGCFAYILLRVRRELSGADAHAALAAQVPAPARS